jgi:hypothetical protein
LCWVSSYQASNERCLQDDPSGWLNWIACKALANGSCQIGAPIWPPMDMPIGFRIGSVAWICGPGSC